MAEDIRLSAKVKNQITRFAARLGAGLSKPDRRFVTEMLYGIQAGKDVKVSNIARSLNESIALIKTEGRLCRRLATNDLTYHINSWLGREGALAVNEDTVLAVDLGDIRKTYAKSMEHLAFVHDGSAGDIAPGYWLGASGICVGSVADIGYDIGHERQRPIRSDPWPAEPLAGPRGRPSPRCG